LPKIQVDALRLDKFIGLLEVVLVGFETLVSFVFSGIVSFVGLVVLGLLVLFSGVVWLIELEILVSLLFSGIVSFVEFPMHVLF